MKCIYCDKTLPEYAVFCPTCGSPVVGEEPLASADKASVARHRRHRRKVLMATGLSVGISAAVGAATALIVINRKAISQVAAHRLVEMRGRLSELPAPTLPSCCMRNHLPHA